MTDGSLWMAIGVVIVVLSVCLLYRGRNQKEAQNRQFRIQSAFSYFLDFARRGIPIKIICGEIPNIVLNKGEDVLCVLPKTTLLEPRAVRTWRSKHGGPSFRIVKGVSFRLGASSGVSESHEEMRAIDTGTLMLTNERLSFVGSRRTINVPIEKIIDVDNEGYSNWLRLNRQGRQKTECFQFNSALYTDFSHNGEKMLAPVHSRMLKLAIDQAILFRRHGNVPIAVEVGGEALSTLSR
jgi:hypothetical protein